MAAELGSAAVSGVASKVAEVWFDSIKREISYVFKYQSYIDVLKNQLKDLEGKRQMVEEPVKHADRQGDEIYKAVKDWLNSVDYFTEKVATPITGGEDEAKRRCFKGLCPNFFKRYSLSKKAVKAAKEGADLLGKGNFTDVSYRPALEKTELVRVRGYEQFDSRLKVFQDVMEVLNDSNVDMIGVYGMGGVGKTTLVKQVARKVIEDKLFDKVILAEVSDLDLSMAELHKKIQDKIAYVLDLEIGQKESMLHRADLLRARLKKEKRVLIILDNLWKKFEFDEVGIPFRDDENQRKNDQRRCTIILTSRSRDLLCKDLKSQNNFPIEVLSNEEAEQLFEKIVGDSAKDSDFRSIGHEIVGKCGGLPVALNTIANALKNEDLPIWKDALNQLKYSNPINIRGMEKDVYPVIKWSYQFLKNKETKYLFLLCSLLRTGDSIKIFDLLRYGMGLRLFRNVYTLETARNRVDVLIASLKDSCLLLDGDAEDEIKMHDVICAVAVSIAEEEELMFNIQNISDLTEERINKNSTAISVPYNIQELPEERLEFPQLKFLLLRAEYGSSLQIPDFLFEGMKQLKVLNLTRFQLPSSLGCLINLQTLCLESCELQDIAMVGQLKKLEILSLRDSNIEELPTEIGQLRHLQLLDLTNCERLEVIPPNVISKLSRLEELYIGGLVELKGLSKLTTLEIHIPSAEIISQDLELKGLQNIVNELEGFPRMKHFLIENCHEISHIVSSVDQVHCKVFPLLESLFLYNLINLEKVCQGQLTDNQSFSNLMIIEVKECHRLKHLFSFSMAKNLLRLQKIEVGDCSNLEMIVGPDMEKSTRILGYKKFISEDDSQLKVFFPSLEELHLNSLTSIEKICHNMQFQYQNLKKVTLSYCKGLKYMFSYSKVNSLVQLEHLNIVNCESMEAVVVDTISTGLGGRDEGKLIEMVFPKLNYLSLLCLPKLTSFAIGMVIHSVEFPSLLELDIRNCPNLIRFISMSSLDDHILTETQPRHFFDEKVRLPNLEELTLWSVKNLRQIWHYQLASDSLKKLNKLEIRECDELISIYPPMVALPSLMTLRVHDCNVLRSLMTLSMAQSMVKLTSMEIFNCKEMEEIIQQELGEEVKDDRIIFTQLKYIKLVILTSLKSFCLGDYTLEFSSLEQVYVHECRNMKTFSQGDLLTPKLHKVNHKEGYWEGNLNSTIQKMFKEMVGFRYIWNLRLSLYPHLKEIWHSQELPVSFFNELLFLEMDGCMDMSSAIPMNLLRCLNNLYRLAVSNCDSLEVVFHLEELNVDEHFGPLLPKLKYLKLTNLPKLQRFCNFTGNIIALPSLTGIRIENCPNMEAFVSNSTSVHMIANKEHQEMTLEENFLIDDIQPFFNENVAIPRLEELELSTMPKLFRLRKERLECSKLAQSWVSFQNLTTLEVSGSQGSRSLMSLSRAESVMKLAIREMTQQVGEEVMTDIGLVFVHLKYLKLHHLPSLVSFCVGNYILEFPSLLQVIFS